MKWLSPAGVARARHCSVANCFRLMRCAGSMRECVPQSPPESRRLEFKRDRGARLHQLIKRRAMRGVDGGGIVDDPARDIDRDRIVASSEASGDERELVQRLLMAGADRKRVIVAEERLQWS